MGQPSAPGQTSGEGPGLVLGQGLQPPREPGRDAGSGQGAGSRTGRPAGCLCCSLQPWFTSPPPPTADRPPQPSSGEETEAPGGTALPASPTPNPAVCGGRGGIQATWLPQSWSSWATEGTPAVTTDDTTLLREPTAWRRQARAPMPPGSPADPLGRGPGPACCGEPASTGRGMPRVQAAAPSQRRCCQVWIRAPSSDPTQEDADVRASPPAARRVCVSRPPGPGTHWPPCVMNLGEANAGHGPGCHAPGPGPRTRGQARSLTQRQSPPGHNQRLLAREGQWEWWCGAGLVGTPSPRTLRGSSCSHMRGSRAHTRPGSSKQPTWAEKISFFGTSLVVWWIRLHPPNAGGTGSISSWELRGQVPSDADKQ